MARVNAEIVNLKKETCIRLLAEAGYVIGSYNTRAKIILEEVAAQVGLKAESIRINYLTDPEFRRKLSELNKQSLAKLESKLDQFIDNGNFQCLMFKLKAVAAHKYDEHYVRLAQKHEYDKELLEMKVKLKQLELELSNKEDEELPTVNITIQEEEDIIKKVINE
jgi:hypothetical protein